MIPVLASALAMLAAAPTLSDYEGVARDSFAAWSYTSGKVQVNGSVRTTSIMTRYDTPTPFNGNPTPVAWSIHTVQIDCAARTIAFVSGANYAASGAVINAATPSPAAPWTDGTAGLQQLAATVCATNF